MFTNKNSNGSTKKVNNNIDDNSLDNNLDKDSVQTTSNVNSEKQTDITNKSNSVSQLRNLFTSLVDQQKSDNKINASPKGGSLKARPASSSIPKNQFVDSPDDNVPSSQSSSPKSPSLNNPPNNFAGPKKNIPLAKTPKSVPAKNPKIANIKSNHKMPLSHAKSSLAAASPASSINRPEAVLPKVSLNPSSSSQNNNPNLKENKFTIQNVTQPMEKEVSESALTSNVNSPVKENKENQMEQKIDHIVLQHEVLQRQAADLIATISISTPFNEKNLSEDKDSDSGYQTPEEDDKAMDLNDKATQGDSNVIPVDKNPPSDMMEIESTVEAMDIDTSISDTNSANSKLNLADNQATESKDKSSRKENDNNKEFSTKKSKPLPNVVNPQVSFTLNDEEITKLKSFLTEDKVLLVLKNSTYALDQKNLTSDSIDPELLANLKEIDFSAEEIQSLQDIGLTSLVAKKLFDPKLKLSIEDSSKCIETCINMGKSIADKAIEQDLVFIIGNTGAGKSTAINYLLGCEMEMVEESECIQVKPSSKIKEQMPIGHSQSKSKTFIPSLSNLKLGNMLICDAPGFSDTRGVEINISNAINIKNTLKNAKSVRIMLLINAHAASDRSSGIKRIKEILHQLFGTDNIEQYAESIAVGLSHVPLYNQSGRAIITLESLKAKFFIKEAGLPEKLRDNTLILDPLDLEERKDENCSRQDWITKIQSLAPLKDHQSIFQTVLTNDDILMLINLSKQFSIKIKEAFAKQEYVTAAYNLEQMKYLQIIERSEVDELFQQNLNDVLAEIKTLQEAITKSASVYDFDKADQSITKFIDIVSLFSRFEPSLQHQLFNSLAEINSKRIEYEIKQVDVAINGLKDYFYAQCTSNEKLVEILDNCFNNVDKPIKGENSHQHLAGYLTLMSQHESIKSYSENIFTSISRLYIVATEVGKTDIFDKKQIEWTEILQSIALKAAEISIKVKNEKLVAVKSDILIVLDALKNKINYKSNGAEIYPLIKNIDNHKSIESLIKVLQKLREITTIHTEVKTLLKRVKAANAIIVSLPETKELTTWHQFIYERLIQIKQELQVDHAIAIILDTFNMATTWDGLPALIEESIRSFTPSQLKRLQEDSTINAVAQTKFQQVLDEFDQALTWENHGDIVLSVAEKYNITANLNNASDFFIPFIGEDEKLNLLLGKITTIIALAALPESKISFAGQAFFNIFQQAAGKILQRFDEFSQNVKKEELNKKLDKVIAKINNELLPQNDFKLLKKAIDTILEINPKKLSLISLKGKIDNCIADFHSGLTKRDYDTVVTSVTILNKLNETLGIDILEHEEINAVSDVPSFYKTINQHIAELETNVVANILAAFRPEKLTKTPFNYDLLEGNQDFFNALEKFSSLIDITVWKASINKNLAGNVKLLYEPAKVFTDTDTICRFLVQLQILTAQIGPRISELTAIIINHTVQYLDKLDASLTYTIGVAFQGMSLLDDESGRYASEIINLFPHFKRAAREAFTKKTSNRTAEHLLSEMTTIKTDKLTKFYGVFAKEYDKLLGNIIDNHTNEIQDKNFITRRNSVDNAMKIAKNLKHATKFSADGEKVSLLLANIFAVWSHLDAHNGSKFEKTKTALLRPHPSQVLSIFLMMGMDISQAMENHLIEVKTGEGKSVISAGMSIAFALMGYQVDVGCYNPYLAERDNKAFRELFNEFAVNNMIKYSNFSSLISDYITQEFGGIYTSVNEFLKGNLYDSAPPKENKNKSLLFIDEVDVFFSKDFLGVTYNPGVTLASNHYIKFLENLWKERINYVNLDKDSFIQQISNHSLLESFLQEYPGIKPFMPYFYEEIRNGLIAVNNNQHKYIVHNGKIGYVDAVANTITTSTHYSHYTAFAAIKEYYEPEKGKITYEDLESKVPILFNCGQYSFAELPKNYDFIVGVTGTLTTLSDYETKLLEDEYKIKRRTQIPSVFDKKSLDGANEAEVYAGTIDEFNEATGYFCNIRKEIDDCIKLDRAVLVVFETEERLDAFKEFIALHPYEANSVRQNILKFDTKNITRDLIIAEAATRGRVTLMTRQFGRGSDFVCHDSQIRKSGGVAVICTFFPETVSEEIQIKGRTCRQDDPGSFQLIVYLPDLNKFNISTLDELGITPNAKYQKLCDKRKEKNTQADLSIADKVTKAKEKHASSVKLANLFANSKQSFFSFKTKEDRKNQISELLSVNLKSFNS